MSLSTALATYSDCHQCFEAALQLGEITVTFDSHSKAARFVNRSNHFRVLLRQGDPNGESQYDKIEVKRRAGEPWVKFEQKKAPWLLMEGPDGKPVKITSRGIAPQATPEEPKAEPKPEPAKVSEGDLAQMTEEEFMRRFMPHTPEVGALGLRTRKDDDE